MKLKTLAALLVMAHALVHPAVHTVPVLAAAPEQAQAPASSDRPGLQLRSGLSCLACAVQRSVLLTLLFSPAAHGEEQPVVLLSVSWVSSFYAHSRPARAPPLA